MNMTNSDPLLDVRQAAEYLGATHWWLYRNYKAQGIHPHRVGGQLRWRPSTLERWLNSQQAAA